MSKLLSLDSCCFIEHNVLKEKLELLDKKLCSTKEKVQYDTNFLGTTVTI